MGLQTISRVSANYFIQYLEQLDSTVDKALGNTSLSSICQGGSVQLPDCGATENRCC